MQTIAVDFLYPTENGGSAYFSRSVYRVPSVGDKVDFLSTDNGPADLFVVKEIIWHYNDWASTTVECVLERC